MSLEGNTFLVVLFIFGASILLGYAVIAFYHMIRFLMNGKDRRNVRERFAQIESEWEKRVFDGDQRETTTLSNAWLHAVVMRYREKHRNDTERLITATAKAIRISLWWNLDVARELCDDVEKTLETTAVLVKKFEKEVIALAVLERTTAETALGNAETLHQWLLSTCESFFEKGGGPKKSITSLRRYASALKADRVVVTFSPEKVLRHFIRTYFVMTKAAIGSFRSARHPYFLFAGLQSCKERFEIAMRTFQYLLSRMMLERIVGEVNTRTLHEVEDLRGEIAKSLTALQTFTSSMKLSALEEGDISEAMAYLRRLHVFIRSTEKKIDSLFSVVCNEYDEEDVMRKLS